MAFIVLYDACVLYPAPLRDLLIRAARTGVVWRRSEETAAFRSSEFPGDRESSSRDRCGRTTIGAPLICPIASS
jgi:hypothetical protein